MDGEHLSAEHRINKGFFEKFNIAIFAVPSKSSLIFTSFFKLLKYIRTGIEVVITGLTRNNGAYSTSGVRMGALTPWFTTLPESSLYVK